MRNVYDYLAHHQAKGAKWGERRYQNYDGSYTPLGRQHYGIGPPRGEKFEKVKEDSRNSTAVERKARDVLKTGKYITKFNNLPEKKRREYYRKAGDEEYNHLVRSGELEQINKKRIDLKLQPLDRKYYEYDHMYGKGGNGIYNGFFTYLRENHIDPYEYQNKVNKVEKEYRNEITKILDSVVHENKDKYIDPGMFKKWENKIVKEIIEEYEATGFGPYYSSVGRHDLLKAVFK